VAPPGAVRGRARPWRKKCGKNCGVEKERRSVSPSGAGAGCAGSPAAPLSAGAQGGGVPGAARPLHCRSRRRRGCDVDHPDRHHGTTAPLLARWCSCLGWQLCDIGHRRTSITVDAGRAATLDCLDHPMGQRVVGWVSHQPAVVARHAQPPGRFVREHVLRREAGHASTGQAERFQRACGGGPGLGRSERDVQLTDPEDHVKHRTQRYLAHGCFFFEVRCCAEKANGVPARAATRRACHARQRQGVRNVLRSQAPHAHCVERAAP
jgi:hypothetical protein